MSTTTCTFWQACRDGHFTSCAFFDNLCSSRRSCLFLVSTGSSRGFVLFLLDSTPSCRLDHLDGTLKQLPVFATMVVSSTRHRRGESGLHRLASLAAFAGCTAVILHVRPASLHGFSNPSGARQIPPRTLASSMWLRAVAAQNPMPSYTHEVGSHPIYKWGGLSSADRRVAGGGAKQLGELLYELAQLAPCRYSINGLSIMDTTVDMRAGRADVRMAKRKDGRTMLTFSSKDSSFNLKLDADAIVEATLEENEETGQGYVYLWDDKRRKHLTATMIGSDAQVHFQILLGRWGKSVRLKV